jgi:SAM-dependent methyltransferase
VSNGFDSYAESYEQALDRGLALSGESKDYFARERVRWLSRCLSGTPLARPRVLDFGCGTGGAAPYLLHYLDASSLLGIDTSTSSIEIAQRTIADSRAAFAPLAAHTPAADFDLAFCNGVFHHIEPDDRPAALEHIRRSLRPGGYFAFWENNPWNPGTRLVMSRIPFDRDAKVISAPAARSLLRAARFEILRVDFLFIFPAALRALRPLERHLTKIPAGGQYQVLCRIP